MKARITAYFSGPRREIRIGDIVENDEARRFVDAGYAVPIVEREQKETATAPKPEPRRKTSRKPKS